MRGYENNRNSPGTAPWLGITSPIKILPFLFRVRAGNSSKSVAYFLISAHYCRSVYVLSACLSQTREVKQVFFIPIVASCQGVVYL